MTPRLERFESFIRERQYLTNISPNTIEWYRRCEKWLPCESPTQDELKALVVRMREKGLKETAANAVFRCLNAYLHWASGSERKCGAGCNHPRIHRLREPQLVMPTFTDTQVKRLVSWKTKAKNYHHRRLHLFVLFLLDTGARSSEILGLRSKDIDLDNLLVTLDGKGRKQRVVPFSFELRKSLYRYIKEFGCKPDALLFACKTGTLWSRRNALREVRQLCRDLGFEPPPRTVHAFRHTFAVNYLRRGGSVFHLQKVLGHTSLEMTRRYTNLVTTDLQAVHERVSLLSSR